jgi:hypothetical protein
MLQPYPFGGEFENLPKTTVYCLKYKETASIMMLHLYLFI